VRRFRTSLSVRLIVWFVLVQSGLAIVAMIVTLYLQRQPGDEYAFAQMHLNAVVAAALVDGPDGQPVIADTPELRAFKAQRPGVGIAALRGSHVLRGSSPSLVAALDGLGTPRFLNANFVLTRGPWPDPRWWPPACQAAGDRSWWSGPTTCCGWTMCRPSPAIWAPILCG
jgi:hypothetical protein